MSKFKVYIIAHTHGEYMFLVSKKVYRNLGSANKRLEELKENYTEDELKILVADNWHELEVENERNKV